MGHAYDAPEVWDYGSLVEVTSAVHLLLGHSVGTDLSFSSPVAGPGAGVLAGGGDPSAERLGTGAVVPTMTATGGAHGVVPGSAHSGSADGGGVAGTTGGMGGGAAGGGPGGGHAAGGGELPFTGFAAAGVAAIGTALAGAGSALRRRLRQRG